MISCINFVVSTFTNIWYMMFNSLLIPLGDGSSVSIGFLLVILILCKGCFNLVRYLVTKEFRNETDAQFQKRLNKQTKKGVNNA